MSLIEAIQLDEATFSSMGVGLPDLAMSPALSMSGLSKIVVLAGPNGGGKSRLLRLLQKLATKKLNQAQIAAFDARSKVLTDSEQDVLQRLEFFRSQNPPRKREIDNDEQALAGLRSEVARIAETVRASATLKTNDEHSPRFVSFVPTGYQLHDPSQWTQRDQVGRASRFAVSIEDSQSGATAHAMRVLQRATEDGYRRLRAGITAPSEGERDEERLLEILRLLLGSDAILELRDGQLKVGRFDPYWQALSAGQQMLFQFGCLLHAQAAQVRDAVVLMDEPENHLHPGMLIQVIDALLKLIPEGQLWIATHSVPLIAHLMGKDPDCLWFVNDGRVKRAGRTPEIVLNSLLGGEQGAKDLQALTQLPDAYAANRFLAQCLAAPGVVGPDVKDPQTLQIQQALWQHHGTGMETGADKLRVLDFGAGKGRLVATLADSLQPGQQPWFDYIAYDLSTEDRADATRQIAAVYGSSDNRWFDSLDTVAARLDRNSVDAVVMCNVLHEVDPTDWIDIARRCAAILKPSGNLVIVEDYGIRIGERAHDYGFLLLDEGELSALFNITEGDRAAGRFRRASSDDPRYRNRLVVHLVSGTCVARLSAASRIAAIEALARRVSGEVRVALRKRAGSSKDGQDYARSAQLLANSNLWLRDHADQSVASSGQA